MFDSPDDLKRAIESLHNCQASFKEKAWIVERFQNQTVWEGYVYTFEITGHPTATICYAWSHPIEGSTKHKYYAVLHAPPVESPADAVRAAIRSDLKQQGL